MKTRDLVDNGKGGLIESWRECPSCCQCYQCQVALDMANALLSFINKNYPGSKVIKMGVFTMIINTILSMDYWKNLELREEGKRAASQMISTIQGSGADINNVLTIAYIALARFSEADETRDGYKMGLHYYEKV